MSDERMSDAEKEIDELLTTATPEERKEICIALFEWIYETSDDERLARFKEMIREEIAKRGAH